MPKKLLELVGRFSREGPGAAAGGARISAMGAAAAVFVTAAGPSGSMMGAIGLKGCRCDCLDSSRLCLPCTLGRTCEASIDTSERTLGGEVLRMIFKSPEIHWFVGAFRGCISLQIQTVHA